MFKHLILFLYAFCALTAPFTSQLLAADEDALYEFTDADRQFLSGFSLNRLGPLPSAPDNAFADDIQAARLGHRLFFDTGLSVTGEISCASCHKPELFFADDKAVSVGVDLTRRNAPSIPGAIYGEWFYWDGRKDSLWSQALAPLELSNEHGLSRLEVATFILSNYKDEYVALFGDIEGIDAVTEKLLIYAVPASPVGDDLAKKNWDSIDADDRATINRIFSNVGKSIMAYERRLALSPSRFDQFIDALTSEPSSTEALKSIYTPDEAQGLRLFMGVGNCASCHNGPMLSNQEFHNIGVAEADEKAVDLGRYEAIDQLLVDEFTCLSEWSDAKLDDCEEMNYLKRVGPELVGAFKTPSLRNVAVTAPYMQMGQLATLSDVIAHYNKPKPPFYDREQHPNRPHFDILPLRLEDEQLKQLEAFLTTLTSDRTLLDPEWWEPPK